MHGNVPRLDDLSKGSRQLDVHWQCHLHVPLCHGAGVGAPEARHDGGRLRDVADKVVAGSEGHGISVCGRPLAHPVGNHPGIPAGGNCKEGETVNEREEDFDEPSEILGK